MVEEPKKDLAIPRHREIKGGAANILADGIESIIKACKSTADFIRNKVDKVLELGATGYPIGIRENILARVAGVLDWTIKKSRKMRLLEKVSFENLPPLIEGNVNREGNIRLQCEIVDTLDSSITVELPLQEELGQIAKRTFDMGVPPEKLIKFLEDDQILDLLIEGVLNAEHSRFRAHNLSSLIYSSLQSVQKKLRVYADKQKKLPVEGEVEEKIRRNLAYLKRTFDPNDIKYTITNTTRILQERYPDYDIVTWLKENMHLLIEIISGVSKEERHKADEDRSEVSHMSRIVNEVYEERGKTQPEQFVRLNISRFFGLKESAGTAYLNKMLKNEGIDNRPFLYLDIDNLKEYFEESLTRLSDRDLGVNQLRNILISETRRFATLNGSNTDVLVARKGIKEYFIAAFEDTGDMLSMIDTMIKQTCPVISSHVDVVDVLANPKETPPEIMENYSTWFEPDGSLVRGTRGPYYKYLRKIFGLPEDEKFERVKERVETMLGNVNSYIDGIIGDLGMPDILIEHIRNTNDYAQLVKIACESKLEDEKFLARLKIELAILIYSCTGTPRWVFRDHEAKGVKASLEKAKGGIRIEEHSPLREIEFIDCTDGTVEMIDEGETTRTTTMGEQRKVKLIPAQFAKIPCWLLPANNGDDEEETDDDDYIGIKSLRSLVTKLLHREKTRARDVTDILRMTIVVDSVEDLIRVQKELESNYISFGRSLKRENRYGKFVRVKTYNTAKNASKSDEYRALRYVVDVPIKDTSDSVDYFAPIEIRVLMTEDLLKERSKYHPASHRKYELNRLRKVFRRLAPWEIFRRFYKETEPDEDDVFERKELVLKDQRDFGQLAIPANWPQNL